MNLDVTTYNAGGYHGDLNETFCVGSVDADGQRVVRTAFDCLAAALDLVAKLRLRRCWQTWWRLCDLWPRPVHISFGRSPTPVPSNVRRLMGSCTTTT